MNSLCKFTKYYSCEISLNANFKQKFKNYIFLRCEPTSGPLWTQGRRYRYLWWTGQPMPYCNPFLHTYTITMHSFLSLLRVWHYRHAKRCNMLDMEVPYVTHLYMRASELRPHFCIFQAGFYGDCYFFQALSNGWYFQIALIRYKWTYLSAIQCTHKFQSLV